MTSPRTVTRRFPLPASFPDPRTREREAGWRPAVPRAAATVLLVRDRPVGDDDAGVEVFMLRRAATMAFAADAWVFPGGGVDDRDAAVDLPWAGPDPDVWARVLHRPLDLARSLVVAAAREVFEECGVVLAGAGADDVLGDATGPSWEQARAAIVARTASFGQVLTERGLVLRTDLLRAHAHWVTPEFEPRRYDTAFFVALCPKGQRPDGRTSEASEARWVRPRAVLADHAAGAAVLMPPTLVCLEGLAAAADARAVLRDPPPYLTVRPRWSAGVDGPELVAEVPA